MVGIYGTTKDKKNSLLKSGLTNLGDEVSLAKEFSEIKINLVKHSKSSSDYSERNSKHCWLWGDVKGHYDSSGKYKPRKTDLTSSELFLNFYINNKNSELDRLNGDFFAVIFDKSKNTLNLITDRLGSRAAFYTKEGNNISFSNNIQSLAEFSNKKGLEEKYCIEYLAYKRVFGTKTPFKGIEKLHPASVTSFDLKSGNITQEQYWAPKYNPEDKPYSYFVDRFVEIIKNIIEEQIDQNKSYGLMLSGGSDSRLLAGVIDKEITSYHANEWMNPEAKIAKKIAESTKHEFEFLKRDEDYQIHALEENLSIFNFVSSFKQAHFYGFRDLLTKENDVLIHGCFADTFFKGFQLSNKAVNLGLKNLEIPVEDKPESLDDYIQKWNKKSNILIKNPIQVIKSEIESRNGIYQHHGVSYETLDELTLCSGYYPLTNDRIHLHHEHMLQMSHTLTPFLDSRLIDLHLRMPRKYFIRYNIIDSACKRISPKISEIPKPNSKLPQKFPEIIHFSSEKVQEVSDKYLPTTTNRPPKPYYSFGSWTNHKELLIYKNFASQNLRENQRTIQQLNFLDDSKCQKIIEEHNSGLKNHRGEIYRLLTFINTPIIKNKYKE